MNSAVIDIIEASSGSYTEKQQENLQLLRSGTARVVVTGQQLGLLGGPLLTLYKIITAVKLAEVRTESGSPAVPLFWLQSEDHDTVEINELSFVSDDGRLSTTKLNSERLSSRNRIPVGMLEEFSELPLLLKGLGLELPLKNYTIQSSFQSVINKFFGGLGLLFIDPLKLQRSGLTVPIYETSLEKSDDIEQRLLAKERLMLVEGIDPAVKIRPGSPLFFVQTKSNDLGRYRLTRTEKNLNSTESNSSFTEAELLALLKEEPARFSSSALLRPIIQDSLLEPLAYVGGPAEGRYLELAEAAYDCFGVKRAEFIPRASFLIVEPRVRRAIEKLDTTLLQQLDNLEPLKLREKITNLAIGPDRELELTELLNSRVDALFAELDSYFSDQGEPAKQYLQRSKEKFARSSQGIVDSYQKSFKDRLTRDTKISGLICDSLAPRELDQERVLSWYPVVARLGDGIISTLLDGVNLEQLRKRVSIVL